MLHFSFIVSNCEVSIPVILPFDVKTLFMTITNACKQPSIKRRCSHSFKPPFCAFRLVWKCMLIEICAQGKKWSFFARGYKTCKNQCVDHLYHFFSVCLCSVLQDFTMYTESKYFNLFTANSLLFSQNAFMLIIKII